MSELTLPLDPWSLVSVTLWDSLPSDATAKKFPARPLWDSKDRVMSAADASELLRAHMLPGVLPGDIRCGFVYYDAANKKAVDAPMLMVYRAYTREYEDAKLGIPRPSATSLFTAVPFLSLEMKEPWGPLAFIRPVCFTVAAYKSSTVPLISAAVSVNGAAVPPMHAADTADYGLRTQPYSFHFTGQQYVHVDFAFPIHFEGALAIASYNSAGTRMGKRAMRNAFPHVCGTWSCLDAYGIPTCRRALPAAPEAEAEAAAEPYEAETVTLGPLLIHRSRDRARVMDRLIRIGRQYYEGVIKAANAIVALSAAPSCATK